MMVQTKQTARKSTGGSAPRQQIWAHDPVDNEPPSSEAPDIRADMEAILDDDEAFTGDYSYSQTFPDAPNPALVVEGLGVIGLPLNPREAEVIKGRASQAPFGQADRTVVDTTVRNTWEIDGKQVSFANKRAWRIFLVQTVKTICDTLGVNYEASNPRCELYKLLLYETGSHFLPHVDTEKQDGMFATIVVVLPSQFTGGAIHVSHGGLSKIYDCSTTSTNQTTVLAWYTDVTHEVKPITSGYRLALSYNLVHTTTSLRPALSANTDTLSALRDVLEAWRKSGRPTKLVYLLAYKYSKANLRGSALKGADAHRVALLDPLAKEYGFELGLANLVFHESGFPSNSGHNNRGYGHIGESRRHWSHPPSDGDDMEMDTVESTTMTVENLVNMNGKLIMSKVPFKPETESIPEELEDLIRDNGWDEQEFEGYFGNGAGSLERWYRNSVLVIRPVPGGTNNDTQIAGTSKHPNAPNAVSEPGSKRRKTAYDEADEVIDLTSD